MADQNPSVPLAARTPGPGLAAPAELTPADSEVTAVIPRPREESVPPGGSRSGRHRVGTGRAGEARSKPARPEKFRADVEGLRAVAIGLVLIYHAGLPVFSGGFVGVDVFFVISGFLITTQLIGELDRTGKISLAGFYARRARRILPAAAVVLVSTAVMVRLFVPRMRWEDAGGDIVAAATYVVNWHFAARSVDYGAQDSAPSPVLHYWSLAVEEQYYLVWPLLMIVAALAARVLRVRARTIVPLALMAVAVPTFLWSIWQTAHSPSEAFFSTATRMWELAIGAGVAIAAGGVRTRLPRAVAIGIGWGGLGAIVAAGLLFSDATQWPGYLAAVPTVGTAAVIVAGFSAGPSGPVALLGLAPMRWLGRISYSLYLWHWPLLIVAAAHWGDLGPRRGAIVMIAALLPAWLSYKLVENPLRRSPAIHRSPGLALSLGLNFTLVGAVAGALVLFLSASAVRPAPPGMALGAGALPTTPATASASASPAPEPFFPDRVDFIVPDPLDATDDEPDADACHQNQVDDEVLTCLRGNPNGSTTVVLAGDSKAVQYLPAVEDLANRNDWRLIVRVKSACTLTGAEVELDDGPYQSCLQWNRSLLDLLVDERPDYVITSGAASTAIPQPGGSADPEQAMVDGLRESWTALTAVGIKVIVIADNAHPGFTVYSCVDEHRDQLSACTFDRDRRLTTGGYRAQAQAVQGLVGVTMIDLWDQICPVQQCPPVIGNVLVYRQGSHLTATYAKTLAPALARALTDAGLPAAG